MIFEIMGIFLFLLMLGLLATAFIAFGTIFVAPFVILSLGVFFPVIGFFLIIFCILFLKTISFFIVLLIFAWAAAVTWWIIKLSRRKKDIIYPDLSQKFNHKSNYGFKKSRFRNSRFKK